MNGGTPWDKVAGKCSKRRVAGFGEKVNVHAEAPEEWQGMDIWITALDIRRSSSGRRMAQYKGSDGAMVGPPLSLGISSRASDTVKQGYAPHRSKATAGAL